MISKKIIISLMLAISILSLNNKVEAKYTYTEIGTAVKFNVDRTAPELEIEYIDSNDYIEVVIKANEQIKSIEGWEINEENTSLTKEYYENTEEKITIYDLSGNYTDADISVTQIQPIRVEVISVENNNTGYEKYANNTSKITVLYEINAVARLADRLDVDDILVKIDGKEVENITKNLYWTLDDKTRYQYKLVLENVEGNGLLELEVMENSLRIRTNELDTRNKAYEYNTGITIDNISPEIQTSEELTESGHAKFTILGSEDLRLREEWKYRENMQSMSKEFPSNVEYQISVSDLAGNTTDVMVEITKAEYIKLIYGSYNVEHGWLFAEDMGKFAGEEVVINGGNYPTECLAFRVEGNVEPDFVQTRAYVYSHWTDTLGECNYTGNTYCFGYNPYNGTWRNMKNADIATINGKEYYTFGGVGMNKAGQTDVNGEYPISSHVASDLRYGITAIKFKLADYSEYSIVYQVKTIWYGFLYPSYNETENTMGYPTKMSGIRVTIVPNSERTALYDFWARDC